MRIRSFQWLCFAFLLLIRMVLNVWDVLLNGAFWRFEVRRKYWRKHWNVTYSQQAPFAIFYRHKTKYIIIHKMYKLYIHLVCTPRLLETCVFINSQKTVTNISLYKAHYGTNMLQVNVNCYNTHFNYCQWRSVNNILPICLYCLSEYI